MAYPKVGYDDYLRLAVEKNLKFLHGPDEIPSDRLDRALWQCRVTGEIESRSYHSVLTDKSPFGSHGQKFVHEFIPKYRELAQELGIELLFDPTVDIGPRHTKTPVKWRGKTGHVVVASYHELGYGKIKESLAERLGILDAEAVS